MPAGRPRNFDETAALDAAIEVFRRHGYEGASLDLLTGAMGINRPSLYGTFGDKAELFDKAVSRYVAGPGSVPLAALDAADDLQSGIAGFFAAVTRNNAARGRPRGCLVACVLGEAAGADERWRARAADLARMTERRLGEILARFVAPAKAAPLARMMATLMYGLAAAAKAGLSQAELQTRCEDAIATALLIAGTKPA
jgi:AcrR family transcriptional regulator